MDLVGFEPRQAEVKGKDSSNMPTWLTSLFVFFNSLKVLLPGSVERRLFNLCLKSAGCTHENPAECEWRILGWSGACRRSHGVVANHWHLVCEAMASGPHHKGESCRHGSTWSKVQVFNWMKKQIWFQEILLFKCNYLRCITCVFLYLTGTLQKCLFSSSQNIDNFLNEILHKIVVKSLSRRVNIAKKSWWDSPKINFRTYLLLNLASPDYFWELRNVLFVLICVFSSSQLFLLKMLLELAKHRHL